jgi:hypothetical protein
MEGVVCKSEELDKFKHPEFQVSRRKILCERVRVGKRLSTCDFGERFDSGGDAARRERT